MKDIKKYLLRKASLENIKDLANDPDVMQTYKPNVAGEELLKVNQVNNQYWIHYQDGDSVALHSVEDGIEWLMDNFELTPELVKRYVS